MHPMLFQQALCGRHRSDRHEQPTSGVRLPCLVCGSNQFELYLEQVPCLGGIDGVFDIERCATCRLLVTSPQMSDADISPYYGGGFAAHQSFRPSPTSVRRRTLAATVIYGEATPFRGWQERILARLYAVLYSKGQLQLRAILARPRGRLLDVGCGNGHFLLNMRDFGWEVEGVEFSQEIAQAVAKEHGLWVHPGTIFEADLPARSFDVVTLWHTLEHVLDPVDVLRECHRLLKPSGLLVLEVPNADSLGARVFGRVWYSWMPPIHRAHYSASTIRLLLDRAGFELQGQVQTRNTGSWVDGMSYALGGGRRFAGRTFLRRSRAWMFLLPFDWLVTKIGLGSHLLVAAAPLHD